MLKTDRLIIRQWQESDITSLSKLNADKEALKYFPRTYTKQETIEFIEKMSDKISKQSYGFFALELRETKEFIGFTGLSNPSYKTPFTPCTEIGWRIHKQFWGKGYAPEAAKACLDYAFNELYLDEIVSFTASLNKPSMRVMEKIGMTRSIHEDFYHPLINKTDPLALHVLYRLKKENFK